MAHTFIHTLTDFFRLVGKPEELASAYKKGRNKVSTGSLFES